MSTVRDLILAKGAEVHTIGPDAMVLQAIEQMDRHNIGSLVVVDEHGSPIGIFTERHYARNVFLKGRSSPTTPVSDAMFSGLVSVGLERSVEECMSLMTEHKVRHLPVLDDGKLVGIVSIGDLVQSIIADREFMIEQLSSYISGERQT